MLVLRTVLAVLAGALAAFPTTLDQDEKLLAALQQARRLQQRFRAATPAGVHPVQRVLTCTFLSPSSML